MKLNDGKESKREAVLPIPRGGLQLFLGLVIPLLLLLHPCEGNFGPEYSMLGRKGMDKAVAKYGLEKVCDLYPSRETGDLSGLLEIGGSEEGADDSGVCRITAANKCGLDKLEQGVAYEMNAQDNSDAFVNESPFNNDALDNECLNGLCDCYTRIDESGNLRIKIDCSTSGLAYVPNFGPETRSAVECVNLAFSNFSLPPTVPSRVFADMPSLKMVNLSYSLVHALPVALFGEEYVFPDENDVNTSSLIIDVSHNYLETIPFDILLSHAHIEADFSNNRIRVLEDRIFYKRFVHVVNFEKNNLQTLPWSMFRRVHLLDVVNLKSNMIEYIPDILWINYTQINHTLDAQEEEVHPSVQIDPNLFLVDQEVNAIVFNESFNISETAKYVYSSADVYLNSLKLNVHALDLSNNFIDAFNSFMLPRFSTKMDYLAFTGNRPTCCTFDLSTIEIWNALFQSRDTSIPPLNLACMKDKQLPASSARRGNVLSEFAFLSPYEYMLFFEESCDVCVSGGGCGPFSECMTNNTAFMSLKYLYEAAMTKVLASSYYSPMFDELVCACGPGSSKLSLGNNMVMNERIYNKTYHLCMNMEKSCSVNNGGCRGLAYSCSVDYVTGGVVCDCDSKYSYKDPLNPYVCLDLKGLDSAYLPSNFMDLSSLLKYFTTLNDQNQRNEYSTSDEAEPWIVTLACLLILNIFLIVSIIASMCISKRAYEEEKESAHPSSYEDTYEMFALSFREKEAMALSEQQRQLGVQQQQNQNEQQQQSNSLLLPQPHLATSADLKNSQNSYCDPKDLVASYNSYSPSMILEEGDGLVEGEGTSTYSYTL
eukprot:Nk52_evm7s227 gene=Nk52_evmTU7s227